MATSVRSIFDMSANKVKFRGIGIAFQAAATSTTQYHYQVTEARLLDGVEVILSGHSFGDSITLQVTDQDNLLGLGAGVVLDTFAQNWYVAADSQNQGQIRLPYSAEVVAGLYITLSYTAVGTSTQVFCNLFAHKYLT